MKAVSHLSCIMTNLSLKMFILLMNMQCIFTTVEPVTYFFTNSTTTGIVFLFAFNRSNCKLRIKMRFTRC